MIITKIEINNFGKLKNFTLRIGEGLNVIYGPNEQGKSTVMAFVRMIFYGATTGNDITKNPRKKYRPWDGSSMGGAVEFEHCGKSFRLERTFSGSFRTDKVALLNLASGRPELLPDYKEIGRQFFGMGEASFDKSVFIGQAGTLIDTSDSGEKEIIQKLQNLVSSGDETKSFTEIDARLQAALETLVSRSGRIGILDKLESGRAALEDARDEAVRTEKQKSAMQKEYDFSLEGRNRLEACAEVLLSQREEMKDRLALETLEKIVRHKSEADKLEQEYDSARKLITDGDFEINLEFLEESGRILQELASYESVIGQHFEDISRIKEQISGCSEDDGIALSPEEIESAERTAAEIAVLKERIAQTEYFTGQKESELRLATEKNTTRQKALRKLEEYTRRRIEYEKALEAITDMTDKRDEISKIRVLPALSFTFAIITAAVSVAVGAVFNPFAYAGLVLSVLLTVLGIIASKSTDRRDSSIAGDNMEQRSADILRSLEFIGNDIRDIEEQISVPGLPGEFEAYANTLRQEIADANAGSAADEEALHTRTENFDSYCAKIGAADMTELRKIHMDRQKLRQTRKTLEEMLALKEKLHAEQILAYDKTKAQLIGGQSGFFGSLTTEEALQKHRELSELYQRVKTLRNLLADKNKELRYELDGRIYTDIRDEYDEKRMRSAQSGLDPDAVRISQDELDRVDNELDSLRNSISLADSNLIRIRTEMSQAFAGCRELSEIEEELIENRKAHAFYALQRDSLKASIKYLEEAFAEMQQTFGPIVNDRTSRIFSRITGGRYSELIVGKDLKISVREPDTNTTKDFAYLSSGTIDQVYFSLRLAIAGFFSEKSGGLPLFLDDSFLQYDDERARMASDFIKEYARENHCQIVVFTCHKSMLDVLSGDGSFLLLENK
ncbi:MAG: ATP-binding protein [Saccharofermentanales bacterium]